MCCGSKRSALSSASASRPRRAVTAPTRAETILAPVTAAPIPSAPEVGVRGAAGFASSGAFPQSPQRQDAPPQAVRRWRLSS